MSAAASFAGPQAYSYAAARPLVYVDPDGRRVVPEVPVAPVEVPAYPEGPMPQPVPMPNVPMPHDIFARPRLDPRPYGSWNPRNPPLPALCPIAGCDPAGAAFLPLPGGAGMPPPGGPSSPASPGDPCRKSCGEELANAVEKCRQRTPWRAGNHWELCINEAFEEYMWCKANREGADIDPDDWINLP